MILREAWREVCVCGEGAASRWEREKERDVGSWERHQYSWEMGAGEREGGGRGGWMEVGSEGIEMMKRERREIQRCWGWWCMQACQRVVGEDAVCSLHWGSNTPTHSMTHTHTSTHTFGFYPTPTHPLPLPRLAWMQQLTNNLKVVGLIPATDRGIFWLWAGSWRMLVLLLKFSPALPLNKTQSPTLHYVASSISVKMQMYRWAAYMIRRKALCLVYSRFKLILSSWTAPVWVSLFNSDY